MVGNGNYWVTFVAQSQFILIRCLWTLILKAWRPLRVEASSSIDGGSAFQVLTYPWVNDRAIVAFDRTGRSRESRNEWLSESWCLVLGLSTGVSWAGSRGWSMVRRGPLSSLYKRHRAPTARRRARLSMMFPHRLVTEHAYEPCQTLEVAGCSTRPYKWAKLEHWPNKAFICNSPAMVVEKRAGLSQEPNELSGSNSSGAQMWTVA